MFYFVVIGTWSWRSRRCRDSWNVLLIPRVVVEEVEEGVVSPV